MVLSVARYLVRMRGRATPFGIFAGVAPLRFGHEACAPPEGRYLVRARADARWLAEIIAQLERAAEVRRRLRLVVNDMATVRGERVVVAWAPHACPNGRGASAQVSIHRSPAVEAVLAAAQGSIRGGDLIEKLASERPRVPVSGLDGLLAQLMACGVLISALRPTSTSGDGLAHVLACLDDIDAHTIEEVATLVEQLRGIHAQLSTTGSGLAARPLRERMRALSGVVEQPMMVDCRLGGAMALPSFVADEAAGAASALVRATPHPTGDPRMREYHARFIERFGSGAFVRVDQLIDPTVGLGFPPHYDREDDRGGLDPRVSRRDERLLAAAQQAALDGAVEVELSEEFLDALAAEAVGPIRPAPHVELCAEVHASTVAALRAGEFTLAVQGIGRSALALSGRFLDLLPAADQQRMTGEYARLPTSVEDALAPQLSFPPRYQRLGNVARAPRVLPTVLALAEHRKPALGIVSIEDLVVTADGNHLYVVSLSRRRVVEPVVANAAARRAWPPLARLLVEIARSGTAAVSPFAWGAASCLPFLPRVRYRRSVLCPARWRLRAGTLPTPGTPWQEWELALAVLRDQLRLPAWVSVGDGDRLLRLNLDEPMDAALFRDHLDQAARAGTNVTVAEAPTPAAHGWAGERAHEIVVPLATATPRAPAPVVLMRTAATPEVIGPDHGALPGERVVFARLYGHPDHTDAILIRHLGRLLSELGEPMWWFIRYRDPSPHLRLRLHPHPHRYGSTVVALGKWAADLRRRGLVGDLMLNSYRPETARYGRGPVLDAAEALFAADSAAARTQISTLTAARHVPARALTAASMVDLAAAMTGGPVAGMRWLLDRRSSRTVGALVRDEVRQAVRLADPADDHAALRSLPAGELIVDAWQARRRAATTYHARLAQAPAAPAPESVLVSLLHLHHIRAIGIDPDSEHLTERTARAVALAWSAHNTANAGPR
jgi:class I lanthipeptide synthase